MLTFLDRAIPTLVSSSGLLADWNSALYLKFENERTRAARDLVAQIPDFEPNSIFDLGCGPGNGTELLAAAFPRAKIVGLDLSDNMLAVARVRVTTAGFVKQDIETWSPVQKVDLIFANASLHFVPNHHELMVRLVAYLNEGGRLAVQMPNNIQELSHALMRMVAADGPWADRLVPIAKTRPVIGALDFYYQLLTPVCSKIDIWQTTYVHPLDGPDDFVAWFEGSALRPFLELLSPSECEAFLARYRAELSAGYPKQPDGKVLLSYPRLFFVAQK
jgi:trans-aconitate 2-methyltransferase